MKHLRCVFLLQFVAILAQGQTAHPTKPLSLPNEPEPLVRSLYTEVVARHPLGSPGGADVKVFAPYLGKVLLHRIEINVACQNDWDRQNPDPNSKPPFLEIGLFSGDDLRAEPQAFNIERVQAEKDGTIRVYVKLTHDEPGESPWFWHVAAILRRENGHFVVNDVIYLKDGPQDVDARLSEYLSQGCDGPHWVGLGGQKKDRKQQKK
jgi:hypothetical protein